MALQATMVERCLLYLLDLIGVLEHNPAAEKLTQDSIAEVLNARQAHISRTMKQLNSEGCVRIVKIHVRSGKRRFAYFLTEKGARMAKDLRRRFEDLTVKVVDFGGKEDEYRLCDVLQLLPRRPRFSHLVASVEDGQIDLRRFATWQGRLHEGKVFDVRDTIVVPHFSGRNDTISRLDRFLEEVGSRGFLLVGLPGIGKTALASEWVAHLKGSMHVFWRGVRPDTSSRDILLDLADMLHSIGRPSLSNYLHRPSEGNRDMSWDLLKQSLSGLRVLLVFDNAHLVNDDFAGLITSLLHTGPAPDGPKIILLSRERVRYCTAEDKMLGIVHEEELIDLTMDEAMAMLSAMGVDADRHKNIIDRCGGHPLSLELATGESMQLDTIKRTSITRLVQDVLSRLDSSVRDTLAFAAMFDGGIPLDQLGGHAPELLRLCILREEGGGRVGMHDLVRNAALETIPPDQLKRLHLRTGDFLSRSHNPNDSLQAIRHFIAGEALQKACELSIDRGLEMIDAGLAENLITLLSQLSWTLKGDQLGSRILLLQGHALFALGRWADAAEIYDRCSSEDEPGIMGEALLGQGRAEVQRYSPLALEHLLGARELLERTGALRSLAEAQYWIGCLQEDAGRVEEARESFERGRAIAFDIGDRRWEGLCVYGVGRLHSLQNDEVRATTEYQEALTLLEREGCRLESAKVCAALGGGLTILGRTDEAETFISRAITEARATGAISTLASSLYNLASLKQKAGCLKDAIPLLEEALVLYEWLEKYDKAAWCAAWIASENWTQGNEGQGDTFMSRAERLLGRTTESALRVQVLRNFSHASKMAGRREDARHHLDRAIAEARTLGLSMVLDDLMSELGGLD